MASGVQKVPFEKQHALYPSVDTDAPNEAAANAVPGQPCLDLSDRDNVLSFLARELSTTRLDSMYSMLFLVSNKQNISPLHHQIVKGRQIIITERSDLHLAWYYDRIFIKPIPLCLFKYSFYSKFIAGPRSNQQLHAEACGFLRTYASLIVYRSDFDIAQRARLIPDFVSWDKWCHYIKHIAHLSDAEVARRYHYGELRLTRLNFYCKVFGYGWSYFEVHYQYAEYFARFFAPYLFIFGGISVILAAMQTALTADAESVYKGST